MGWFFSASWWWPHCCAVWMQKIEILFFCHSYKRVWRRERWKAAGHHPENFLLVEQYGLSLMSQSHSFQYFGSEVSLFWLQQGYNISYITFSLPFLGLTTLVLGSLDSLELSPRTVSVHYGTPQTWLPFVLCLRPWLLCVSHFCSLFLSGQLPCLIFLQIFFVSAHCRILPTPLGCCLFAFCSPSL